MKLSVRQLILAALFAALTFISGSWSIPVGPVPVTAQTLFVLLAGYLLPASASFLAMIVFVILRMIFGGIAIWLLPSFGFILAFVLVAPGMSLYLSKRSTNMTTLIIVGVIATLVIYLIGVPYMGWILNGYLHKGLTLIKILQTGMLIFLPGDILKLVLAAVIAQRVRPILQKN